MENVGARVLVVEDDRATQVLLRAGIAKIPGVELCPERPGDGREGLRAIRTWMPDLVLLDLVMPNWSGLYLLEELRWDPPEVRPRIVVVSRVTSEYIVDLAFSLGADFYLRKPVNLEELTRLVELLLRRAAPPPSHPWGQAQRILREMGAQQEWLGFRWAALVAEQLAGHVEEMLLKESYYPAIRESGGTYDSVDKNIRDLVAKLHARNSPAYQKLMGGARARRPANKEFLQCLAREVEVRTGLKGSGAT